MNALLNMMNERDYALFKLIELLLLLITLCFIGMNLIKDIMEKNLKIF